MLTCCIMHLIAGEDVLSLDVAFIDRSWNYIVKTLGSSTARRGLLVNRWPQLSVLLWKGTSLRSECMLT